MTVVTEISKHSVALGERVGWAKNGLRITSVSSTILSYIPAAKNTRVTRRKYQIQ
jgi:hypothetical protein